jgi:prepilin-type N-terminal cleavage/methylation domain-containing protein
MRSSPTNANSRRQGFTLVEALIVAAVIGLLAGIAFPAGGRLVAGARQRICLENRFQIDGAKERYALEHNRNGDYVPQMDELVPYLMRRTPVCPAGGEYDLGTVDEECICSVH